jgi:hypothetical protein
MTHVNTAGAAHRAHPSRQGPRRVARLLSSRGLTLFSETIVVSLAVAVLAIPAVTALPAMAAGASHFRRHVEGESDSLVELGRDFLRALRSGWVWGVASAVAFAAVTVTLTTPAMQGMPGGEVFRWISGAVGVMAAVVLLRAAGGWDPASRWSALIREAAEKSARDIAGSLLLLLALALSALIVWMFAPLVVLVPGMLVLATRAVAARSR